MLIGEDVLAYYAILVNTTQYVDTYYSPYGIEAGV